jgi:hypothetical protein
MKNIGLVLIPVRKRTSSVTAVGEAGPRRKYVP